MASGFFDPQFASLSAETPVSSFTNQCDTCGKTFAHSSSYRWHARTQCDSQTRKRHRKLRLPNESDRCDNVVPDKEDEDEDDGVGPLLNTPECETEGNILSVCLFPLLRGSISRLRVKIPIACLWLMFYNDYGKMLYTYYTSDWNPVAMAQWSGHFGSPVTV